MVIGATLAYDPDAGLPTDAKAWLLVLTDARTAAADDIASYVDVVRRHGAMRWMWPTARSGRRTAAG